MNGHSFFEWPFFFAFYWKILQIIPENTSQDNLLKVVDILGREVNPNKVIDNTTLFYIYSDGTVEKKIIIE